MKEHFYNLSRRYYIVILCIFSIGIFVLSTVPVNAQADVVVQDTEKSQMQLLHIVPDYLEGVQVYPTRHAVVGLDPFESYSWDYIEFPEEWLVDNYYFELWGADNRPLPGFSATKLHKHMGVVSGNRISLNALDATLYPAVRLVLFPQEGAPAISAAEDAVRIVYTHTQNTRLGVFAVLLGAMLIAGTVGIAYWKVPLSQTILHSLPLVRNTSGGGAQRAVQYVVVAVVWASVFGAVVGLYVGGVQILYLLIKLPFLLLATFVFSFASSSVLSLLLGIRASVGELLVQSLRILATFAVSLASLSSLMIFYIIADYSHDQLLTAFMFAVSIAAILAALQLWSWIRKRSPGLRGLAVVLVWLGLYGVVLMQFGWMLRPWVGTIDPIHGSVPFARLDSGSVFEEVVHTLDRL